MPDNKITYVHPVDNYDVHLRRAGFSVSKMETSLGRINKDYLPMEFIDFNNSLYRSVLWDFFKKHFVDWVKL
jgi:hypothetical protein